nr:GGDEF domain-containing protein [Streptomyces nanshensis]
MHGLVLARRLAAARRDPLTGLHTRTGWTRRAQRLLKRHSDAVVVLIDLDAFKKLNDTHGHDAGDAALVATARRLAQWCAPGGVAGRLGGDEFVAVALPRDADPRTLPAALREQVSHKGQLLPVSASVGVCITSDLSKRTLSAAMEEADQAMYRVKGRARR